MRIAWPGPLPLIVTPILPRIAQRLARGHRVVRRQAPLQYGGPIRTTAGALDNAASRCARFGCTYTSRIAGANVPA